MNITLSPLGNLDWTNNSDLVILEFELIAEKDYHLSLDYSKGLHAWFLDQVRQLSPELSKRLHDYPEEKAFSISRLEGNLIALKNKIFVKQNSFYSWYLSIFSCELIQWLKEWFNNFPSHLALYHTPLLINEVRFFSPPTTYEKLWQENIETNFCFTFLSPTSFRRNNHHYPLPHPPNLFHSYLRRWNQFSHKVFSQDDFGDWIDKFVIIRGYCLESKKVAGGKKGSVTGFMGWLELSLGHNYQDYPDFTQLYSTLCRFATYCGTGHKTTFGLGHTILSKGNENTDEGRQQIFTQASNYNNDCLEDKLVTRIDELTGIFLKQKNGKGGNRAENVCLSYANILARRELGMALKDISIELEMPYETVKTYSKRAKKLLINGS
ncbi:CRISPR-associated endoribonuclease Cas6 [Geminocystis herdmanii]|uniref:CRISPR-associated endoribonuclease Cas6 n=1 Tax=Geminocystis herdmanii TaxID=669359 RepID=UPI00036740C7|nr:CRISPR-associated endoribonuclease Cas6 [Geminocystis herdmanii]